MSDFTIYHNPRCSKSRETLTLLQAKGIEPHIVLYLQDPPSPETIKTLLKALNLEPSDIIRKGEALYKTLNIEASEPSAEQLITTMSQNPQLIERPIVLKGDKAVIGRPPESVLSLID